MTCLHAALCRSAYRAIERIPTVRNLMALPLEPWNLWFALRGKGRRLLMQRSAAPELYRALERWRNPDLEQQLGLFFLGEPLPAANVHRLLQKLPGAPDVRALLDVGILAQSDGDGTLRCRLRFVPVGELLLVTDPRDRSIPDFTYLGRDSLIFSERLRRQLRGKRFRRALDLCCGSGIQGITVAQHADQVDGTDVNRRAAAFANLNASLCRVSDRVHFRVGNLAAGLDGPYDLVVANPPYVWLPEEESHVNRDGYGGELGLEIVERILADLNRLLGDHGEAHVICDSPVLEGESALVRLSTRVLGGTKLGVILTPIRYIVYPHRRIARFQRGKGVSYLIYYHVKVSRDLPPGLHEERLPPFSRALNSIYVRIAKPLYA